MEPEARLVSQAALATFVTSLLIGKGLPKQDSKIIADALVWANLRGVDSHGVLRIPGYLARVDSGLNNPKPKMRVVSETGAAAVLEADRAFGQVALSRATNIALEKAELQGIGLCFVRQTTHMGAIGYFSLKISEKGMAGIIFNVSRPNMAYPDTRSAGVATSPITIAVPGSKHAPLMLDMATATQSMGKIQLARDTGDKLGNDWAIDADGNPTTDPLKAKIPTSLGGYKGGGLALMFECLASLAIGNPLIAPFLEGAKNGKIHMQNGVVIAINLSKFGDISVYTREVDRLAAAIKGLPKASGVKEVLVPGERGDAHLLKRQSSGIPIASGTWKRLEAEAKSLQIAMPLAL